MSDNFGSAKVQLEVELQQFMEQLQQGVKLAENAVEQIKAKFKEPVEMPGAGTANTEPLKDTEKAADDARKSVQELGEEGVKAVQKLSTFELVRGVIDGVSNAFSRTKDYVMGFVQDFGTAEQSADKLKFKLEKIGQSDYFSAMSKQALDLMNKTGIDDDDIMNAQAMLTSNKLNAEQVMKLTPLVLDLQAAFKQGGDSGMSLQRVAMMLSKTAGEELYGSLGRLNIIFSDSEKKQLEAANSTERLELVTKKLDGSITGLSERLGGSTLGKLDIAKEKFGNMREEIGSMLAPVILKITDVLGKVFEQFSLLPDTMQLVIVAIVGVGGAITALIPIMMALDIASGGTLIALGLVVTGIAAVSAAVISNIDTIRSWAEGMLGGEQGLNALIQTAEDLYNMLAEFAGFIYDTLVSAFEEVQNVASVVRDQLGITGDGAAGLMEHLKNLVREGLELAKKNFHDLVEVVVNIIREYGNFIARHPDLVNALKFVAEAGIGLLVGYIKTAISYFGFLVDAAGRAVTAIGGIVTAFEGLAGLNLYDAVFNPDKIDVAVNRIKEGFEKVKSSLDQKFEGSNSQTKSGTNASDTYGPPKPNDVNTLKPPVTGSNKKSGKGDGKNDDEDKLETEMLDEIIRKYENKLKLEGATVDAKRDLLNEFKTELEGAAESLVKTENKQKAEDKIVDIKKELLDVEKEVTKQTAEQLKANQDLLQDVDKFVTARTLKSLNGVEKETAEIMKSYDAMYDKISKSKLDAEMKTVQESRLRQSMDRELADSKQKYEEQAERELMNLKVRNIRTKDVQERASIKIKYDQEEDRIRKTYRDGAEREEMLHQLKIARTHDLMQVQSEGQKNIMSLVSGGWQTVMSSIMQGFSQVWTNVFGEANSLFEKFFQYVVQKLIEIAMSEIFQTVITIISGGGTGVLGFLGGLFKAEGGRVEKNRTYIVGEDGPETFTADEDGYILNNRDAMKAIQETPGMGLKNARSDMQEKLGSVRSAINGIDGQPLPGSVMYNINMNSDFNIPVENKSLTGLDAQQWNDIVDREIIPNISQGLKRIGKKTLDNEIKKR